MSQRRIDAFWFLLLVLVTACLNYTIASIARDLYHARKAEVRVRPLDSYTFFGKDHPTFLPVEKKQVRMLVEDSVRYDIDQSESDAEWLWTAPIGDNHVRLGPSYRMFAVSQFHQLHCLRGLKSAMETGWDSMHSAARGHLHHCFIYLKAWTLCDADVTLEPGSFSQRNFTSERHGAEHTCRDWELTYEFVRENWYDWDAYRRKKGLGEREKGG